MRLTVEEAEYLALCTGGGWMVMEDCLVWLE